VTRRHEVEVTDHQHRPPRPIEVWARDPRPISDPLASRECAGQRGRCGEKRSDPFALESRKGGIFSERRFSIRTGDALLGDRFYRRWAIAVAIAGGALAAMVWLYMLRQAAISQWWGIVPVLLAALWAWAIWQFGRW
jgi:hypothetical protein